MKEGFIKSDRTKHIFPKFFSFSQELDKDKEINIQYIRSSDNVADLFTKALPTTTLRNLTRDIEMRHMQDLWRTTHVNLRGAYVAALFFSYYDFVPQGFPGEVFNKAA